MERNRNILRSLSFAGVISLGAVLLSGCGQTDPPTPQEFNDKIEVVTLDSVTAANGEDVRCVMYGAESTGTNDSKSWFGFDCDFEGTAQFPGEAPAVPTSTSTTLG